MKNQRKTFPVLIGAACLSAALFFGCTPKDAAPTPTPDNVMPSITSSATPDDTVAPEPSPTPFAVNPIYGFYAQFQADCGALLDAYAAGLSNRGSAEGLSYSLLLTEHRTYLSEGRITVGRLYGSDGEGYSGTLDAAAPGNGAMRGNAEKGYTFTYNYNDGSLLMGSFVQDALSFTVFSPDGTAAFYCTMEKAGDKWMSTAANSAHQSELTVNLSAQKEEAILFGTRSGNHMPITEYIEESEEE